MTARAMIAGDTIIVRKPIPVNGTALTIQAFTRHKVIQLDQQPGRTLAWISVAPGLAVPIDVTALVPGDHFEVEEKQEIEAGREERLDS